MYELYKFKGMNAFVITRSNIYDVWIQRRELSVCLEMAKNIYEKNDGRYYQSDIDYDYDLIDKFGTYKELKNFCFETYPELLI